MKKPLGRNSNPPRVSVSSIRYVPRFVSSFQNLHYANQLHCSKSANSIRVQGQPLTTQSEAPDHFAQGKKKSQRDLCWACFSAVFDMNTHPSAEVKHS